MRTAKNFIVALASVLAAELVVWLSGKVAEKKEVA